MIAPGTKSSPRAESTSHGDRPDEVRVLPVGKRLAFTLSAFLMFFLFVEGLARSVAFVMYGFSPYFLLYGVVESYIDHEEGHSASFDGYFKFPPSKTLHQYGLFSQPTPIRINNRGFRGPDFDVGREVDSIRVVCLGGSSTFGFYARDDFTYPAILERELAARFPGRRVEVINAGVPHFTTDNIAALMSEEVRAYRPDVITIYSAFNDAGTVHDETVSQSVSRWAHAHFASYVALKRILEYVGGPVLHSRWSTYSSKADSAYISRQSRSHVESYRRNLGRILSEATKSGARVLLIRQPMTTKFSDEHPHGYPEDYFDYEEEVEWIRSNLEREGYVSAIESLMLVHSAIVEEMDRFAVDEDVPVVDNHRLIGGRKDLFASYVHLTEAANEALAMALADRIEGMLDDGEIGETADAAE